MAADLTVVLFALPREARPFLRRQPRKRVPLAPCPVWQSTLGVRQGSSCSRWLVLQTGMGAAATERALRWLLGSIRPARVLSAGFCGGLTDGWPPGTLVQPLEVLTEDGGRWPAASGPPLGMPGRLVTVAAPVLGIVERRELARRTGAEVVDMESAAAARLCCEVGVPLHLLRVISDDVEEPLPHDLLPALEGGKVRLGRLLRSVLRRPGLARDLWRLQRHTARAAAVLAEAVERFVTRLDG